MTITTTFVTVLRRFEYLAEKVMYSNHYTINYDLRIRYSSIVINHGSRNRAGVILGIQE
jgi:hypothetical protein